jgi:hypothetical protein
MSSQVELKTDSPYDVICVKGQKRKSSRAHVSKLRHLLRMSSCTKKEMTETQKLVAQIMGDSRMKTCCLHSLTDKQLHGHLQG